MEGGGKRMAVLAGCNYHGTVKELHGCINDVVAMKQVLISKFGFKEDHIQVLIDEPNSVLQPTGAHIKNAIKRMIERAQEGDVLFFSFSGHGTLTPGGSSTTPDPHPHPPKMHEAIVPCDFNLIADVDFRELVNKISSKVTLTMLSDSCHSGGLIDQEKEQVGPSTYPPNPKPDPSLRPKFIPVETILDNLRQLTGLDSPNIGDHMVEHFKDEASLSFRLSEEEQDRIKKGDHGILLSGCQSDEKSEEDPLSKPPHGVFSYAIQTVLDRCSGQVVSNKELVIMAREFLHEQRKYNQHPCLYCSDQNVDAAFLMKSVTG